MERKIGALCNRCADLSGPHRRFFHRVLAAMTVTLVWEFVGAPVFPADKQVIVRLWDQRVVNKMFQQQIFMEFSRENPAIKVEYIAQIPHTYLKILEDSFLAGNPPDIFGFPTGLDINLYNTEPYTFNTEISFRKLLELGWAMPLDQLAPGKEELQAWMDIFPKDRQPFLENANMFFGKVYSWPRSVEGFWVMLFRNTRLFSQAGLKGLDGGSLEPETWDEMRLAARKITELGQGKVYGIVHGIKTPGIWEMDIFSGIATSAGWPMSTVTEPLGGFDYRTGRYDFHHPGLLGSIQLWFDLRKDGSIFPGDLSIDMEQARVKFAQGQAGMIFGGLWEPSIFLKTTDSLEYDAMLPPIPKRGERKGFALIPPLAYMSEFFVSSRT